MKYLKMFENFEYQEGTGSTSFWEREVDGKTIRLTLDDVLTHLDQGTEMDPEEIKDLLIKTKRDPQRVDAADLNYPVILISSGGEIKSILDGQHRVVKALRDGKKILARILDLDFAPETFKKVLMR